MYEHGGLSDVISYGGERTVSAIVDHERKHSTEKVGEVHTVLY